MGQKGGPDCWPERMGSAPQMTALLIIIAICATGVLTYIGWLIYEWGYAKGTADEIKRQQ